MSEFTPGPWIQFLYEGKPFSILPAVQEGTICEFGKSPTDADARLIAAAPDLFDALELLCHLIEIRKIYSPCAEAVVRLSRAALSKATGAA